MFHPKARLLRVAVALTAAGAMVLGFTASAEASPSSSSSSSRVLNQIPLIHVDISAEGGFTLPATVRSGLVSFEVVGADTASHALQGFRLKPGHTVDEVMHDFELGLLGDFPARAEGARELLTDSVLVGGVVTVPSRAITVTVPLEPATYYFFDLSDLGEREVRIHTITATGFFRLSLPPQFDRVVLTNMENGEPRFITPTQFSATGSFLFVNNGDEIHEVVFRPTTPGITDDYITEFYDAVLAGGPRPPSPWTDVQHGLQALSPGRWAITKLDLAPGLYSEICYVPDDEIGIPHAYEGMHQMVTLG